MAKACGLRKMKTRIENGDEEYADKDCVLFTRTSCPASL
jgi:hypothetical protein